ncbi:gamma-interferon-responsive lysosomal thiol protein-like [Lotus japonicus]|uniref:gamma-interferon-responsive lysosomal thiol protein-like n=1 Tax=Lotus japonicus TaxID=34305 RepID=UPI00258FD6DF|nr:gamma-interferon-responsive lysosomal thiol protein-like [Lotus japonicus]
MVSPSIISLPLILYLSFFSFFFVSPSQSHNNNNNNKVSLALYYESLCPYCSNFIVNYLPKIFTDDLISIVDLNLVPWGNAKLRSATNFTCQHGPNECLLNTVEACAIAAWPELSKHFPFIYCVEDLVYQHKNNEWESCFQKLGLDSRPIDLCYKGEIGKQLELNYAAETKALQPPHTYVPWVVVNGKPLYEDYEKFLSYVCEAYQGTHKPKSCTKASYLSSDVKAMPKHSVSDMEE